MPSPSGGKQGSGLRTDQLASQVMASSTINWKQCNNKAASPQKADDSQEG